VSCCKNCTCYWNRDVNAAINILRIFQHAQQHDGARHKFFSRLVATSTKQKRTAAKRQHTEDSNALKRAKCGEESKTLTPCLTTAHQAGAQIQNNLSAQA
jgi:transposase